MYNITLMYKTLFYIIIYYNNKFIFLVDEIIRVEETINKLNLPTEDVTAFERMDTIIDAEPIDSTMNILQNIIHETADRSKTPLPEMIPNTIPVEEGTR